MNKKHHRLLYILGTFLCLGGGLFFILQSLNENLFFFKTPTQVVHENQNLTGMFRLGGVVKEKSVRQEGVKFFFTIYDQSHAIDVVYEGLLPDLFREGQGVVAKGLLKGPLFYAKEILTKHDENYIPRELGEVLPKNFIQEELLK